MALILHSTPYNKNAFKALIAAEFVGVKIDLVSDFKMGVSNKTPEFLKLNPLGKIPVLETPDGPIFESNAIARYVARLKESSLYGTCPYDLGLIEQWIDVATTEIDANLIKWIRPFFGYAPHVPEIERDAISSLEKALGVLNNYLAHNTYLVGHFVTVADIVMVCNLTIGFKILFTKEFSSEYPHLERYFWTLVNQPQFKKNFGEVNQCEKIPSLPIKVPEKPSEPVLQEPRELPQLVKEEPPKANGEVPKAKEESSKVKEEPLALDDEEAKPKSKPKNPLDLLPPSSMILDEWKRLYSNTKAKDFREVAIKGFWNMFDPEGYSLWFCDYKYNDENTVSFVTMNKVSGFLQRMDLIRKYGFAKLCILGEAPPFKIKGVWLFRGSEIPKAVLEECYDVELYDWAKVDLSDEAQKERVNAYFEEPDEMDGEKLLEAKCFK